MTDTKQKTIYELELHERMNIAGRLYTLRVPGGWIYTQFDNQSNTSTFVPYDEEFYEEEDNTNYRLRNLK